VPKNRDAAAGGAKRESADSVRVCHIPQVDARTKALDSPSRQQQQQQAPSSTADKASSSLPKACASPVPCQHACPSPVTAVKRSRSIDLTDDDDASIMPSKSQKQRSTHQRPAQRDKSVCDARISGSNAPKPQRVQGLPLAGLKVKSLTHSPRLLPSDALKWCY
jgi:hypothetical protein